MVSLFDGIENGELEQLLPCLGGRRVFFDEGEYILMAGGRADQVGMVLSGSVLVFSDDFWGNRTILAHVERGGLFGEAFSFARVECLPVSVTAAEKTEVLFINCERIITVCPSACEFHNRLVRNMLKILAEKNMTLSHGKTHNQGEDSFLFVGAGKEGGRGVLYHSVKQAGDGRLSGCGQERHVKGAGTAEGRRTDILP